MKNTNIVAIPLEKPSQLVKLSSAKASRYGSPGGCENCTTESDQIHIPNATLVTHLDKIDSLHPDEICGMTYKTVEHMKPKTSTARSSFWGFFWTNNRKEPAPSRETHFNRFIC